MQADPGAVGVILAGGLSRRMGGGDKCLLDLGGRPILDHVIARVKPQVASLAINANGVPSRFAAFGLPIIPDSIAGFPGPLGGILAGLDWGAANAPAHRYLASFAADSPFVPLDLVPRLAAAAAAADADIAVAASDGGVQPVIGLWRIGLREDLRRAVALDGVRSVRAWIARFRCVEVEFQSTGCDPFLNINEPADLAAAEACMAQPLGRAGAQGVQRRMLGGG
jgi:molybdopterin-guanine dinucleotide biosynthesis protein A